MYVYKVPAGPRIYTYICIDIHTYMHIYIYMYIYKVPAGPYISTCIYICI